MTKDKRLSFAAITELKIALIKEEALQADTREANIQRGVLGDVLEEQKLCARRILALNKGETSLGIQWGSFFMGAGLASLSVYTFQYIFGS